MSALEDARDRHLAQWDEFRRGLGGEPAWLASLREDARDAFAASGLPHTKLEEWRYTNVAPLASIPFDLPAGPPEGLTPERIEEIASPVFACGLTVFVDGCYSPELSPASRLPGELEVESLATLRASAPDRLEAHLGRAIDVKRHPFAALNTAFLSDGAAILVPEGRVCEQPVHVVFVSSGRETPTLQHPRVLVVAGANSRATIIQDHVSLGGDAGFTNAVTEVHVGPNARADLVILQRENEKSFHVSNLAVRQERDSRFASHTVSLGGRLARNDATSHLAEEGADCTLNGLFVGRGSQVMDNHTLIDHAVPHCVSRELYKGVLGGRARGVFRGRVIVRPDAQGTRAEQSNPNLLLDDGAEIDTKPQLEIYADDVRCSHGSSIGQLDADALFYLRSRGIGDERARELLTGAFAGEILSALPTPALSEELAEELLAKLHGGEAE